MLHPSPAMYSAFMGDVAMWTGLVTGSLMLCSPLLFDRFGWRGVAGATPRFMIATGVRLLLLLRLDTISATDVAAIVETLRTRRPGHSVNMQH